MAEFWTESLEATAKEYDFRQVFVKPASAKEQFKGATWIGSYP